MAKVKTGPKVKRKGGGVPAKAKQVEALSAQITASKAVVLTQYRGMTVQDLQDLRRRLRPKGVEYHVVKNSLFKRAAEQSGRAMTQLLTGPNAVALGDVDEVELAKSVVSEMRTLRSLKIVGAWVGGQVMKAEDVTALAALPPRIQLQATFVGTLQAPLASVVGTITAAQSQLVRVLQARSAA